MTLPIPSQATVSVGARLTSSLWNGDVRDAVNYLVSPPIFQGYLNAGQSIASGSVVPIGLAAERVDTYNGHSTSVNNSRYVCQVAGWYRLVGTVTFPTTGTSRRICVLLQNGSVISAAETDAAAASATQLQLCCVDIVNLAVSDYVEVAAQQNSGVNMTITAGTGSTSLIAEWIHA